MKHFKFFVMVILVIGIFNAPATAAELKDFTGGETGNGGEVIVCYDNFGQHNQTIRSVELLDYYEGRTFYNWIPELGNGSIDERIDVSLSRLEKDFDVARAQTYRYWNQIFDSEAVYIPNVQLTPTQDSNPIVIPNGCEIVQLIIQKLNPVNKKRYFISKDLYDRMDDTNKAGARLHEVAYRELIHQVHPAIDSDVIRIRNAFYSSKGRDSGKSFSGFQFDPHPLVFDASSLVGGLVQCGFNLSTHSCDLVQETKDPNVFLAPLVEDTGLNINRNYFVVSRYLYGPIKWVSIRLEGIDTERKRINFAKILKFGGIGTRQLKIGCHEFWIADEMSFYYDGQDFNQFQSRESKREGFEASVTRSVYVERAYISSHPLISLPTLSFQIGSQYSVDTSFHMNGALKSVPISSATLLAQGKKIKWLEGSKNELVLFSDESIYRFTIGQDVELKTVLGKKEKFKTGDELTFNHHGQVTNMYASESRRQRYGDDESAWLENDVLDCKN